MRVGVTGTSSGLGRWLCGSLDAVPLSRAAILDGRFPNELDAIVHCAFDARKALPASDLAAFHTSNVTLTQRLLAIPTRMFIYVSSVEVYPRDGLRHDEREPRRVDEQLTVTGVFKLLAELLVEQAARRSLIIRCASLVGSGSRLNTIMRVLGRVPGPVPLAASCIYNLVSYHHIEELVRKALAGEAGGIYNAGAASTATLGEIASLVGAQPQFGELHYEVPHIATAKAIACCPSFAVSSLEVARGVAARL